MKSLFFTILLLFSLKLSASPALEWVEIGVDGLTCSQCTRNVELSIRRLDFVKDVEMNLEHTKGKITFKENLGIDHSKLAQAVRDAGFSVRYLYAVFNFNQFSISDDFCMSFGGIDYQFIRTGTQVLNGEITLKLIGKKFLPHGEFKKLKPGLKPVCQDDPLFVTI